jgi:hypothetical protein
VRGQVCPKWCDGVVREQERAPNRVPASTANGADATRATRRVGPVRRLRARFSEAAARLLAELSEALDAAGAELEAELEVDE